MSDQTPEQQLALAQAQITRLRAAVQAEMTHGGIRDEIAQCTSTAGAWLSGDVGPEQVGKAREALQRLDEARNAFYERMEVALDFVGDHQHLWSLTHGDFLRDHRTLHKWGAVVVQQSCPCGARRVVLEYQPAERVIFPGKTLEQLPNLMPTIVAALENA